MNKRVLTFLAPTRTGSWLEFHRSEPAPDHIREIQKIKYPALPNILGRGIAEQTARLAPRRVKPIAAARNPLKGGRKGWIFYYFEVP
ncbi:hypothetical protein [Mastigocoleus sp. MO_188.B34]|uniref:hypothetical protein n=1 Tax=Mastigocoleus sp. MO_188.B34 TaxID=3036635 RepID=UPI00262BAB7C|nr:hypothetical protein [Mastigocoleus sp. MO_188.B34]MDJ0693535.1 hypothetical protein [Mastigocoleus sp. MO_188.B34]